MYGKKRIVFRQDGQVIFAGGKSWSPMGWHGCGRIPGTTIGKPKTVQARLLKERFRYTRPTADHMFRIIKANNQAELKAKIAKAYKLEIQT